MQKDVGACLLDIHHHHHIDAVCNHSVAAFAGVTRERRVIKERQAKKGVIDYAVPQVRMQAE